MAIYSKKQHGAPLGYTKGFRLPKAGEGMKLDNCKTRTIPILEQWWSFVTALTNERNLKLLFLSDKNFAE